MAALCDAGYDVALETSGALDVAGVDARVARMEARFPPATAAVFQKTVSGELAVTFENRWLHKDGSVRDMLVSNRLVRVGDGEYIAAIWHDITDRKAADVQIRKLSLAVEQSPNSVVITDLDGNIEYINEAFVRTSGYSREEMIGQKFGEYSPTRTYYGHAADKKAKRK